MDWLLEAVNPEATLGRVGLPLKFGDAGPDLVLDLDASQILTGKWNSNTVQNSTKQCKSVQSVVY